MSNKSKSKIIVVGKIKVSIPLNSEVKKKIDLEKLYKHRYAYGTRNDALIVLHYKGKKYAIVIEDTGIPNTHDIERLADMPKELRSKGLIDPDALIMRILHHCGIHSLMVAMARSYRVELQECTNKLVDIGLILRRRKL